MRVVV